MTADLFPTPELAVGLSFTVEGVPAPQGSKRAVSRGGKTILIESSKKVAPWRTVVAHAARRAMAGRAPWDEPVAAVFEFWMPRPSTARVWQLWQPTYPDVDKLARSTFDALKMGGVVRDDSLIVSVAAGKRYVPHVRGRSGEAMSGARISLYPLGELERAGATVAWVPVVDTAPADWPA